MESQPQNKGRQGKRLQRCLRPGRWPKKQMAVLPHARASLTFLSREEGGRQSVPTIEALRGYRYRPHIVIGDPTVRETRSEVLNRAQLIHEGDGEYLGIAFDVASSTPEAGKEIEVEFAFMYFPKVTYAEAIPGATFTLREGARIIGFGTILEIEPRETIKANKAQHPTA